jgi:hypothetical protein
LIGFGVGYVTSCQRKFVDDNFPDKYYHHNEETHAKIYQKRCNCVDTSPLPITLFSVFVLKEIECRKHGNRYQEKYQVKEKFNCSHHDFFLVVYAQMLPDYVVRLWSSFYVNSLTVNF